MTNDILLWGYVILAALFFVWTVVIIDEDTPELNAFLGTLITATIWPIVVLFWIGIRLRGLKG